MRPRSRPVAARVALDRIAHASLAELYGGFSPIALALATFDWAAHLAVSPGRQSELAMSAMAKAAGLAKSALWSGAGAAQPQDDAPSRSDDRRFRAPEWGRLPFSLYADGFLAVERWWDEVTSKAARR